MNILVINAGSSSLKYQLIDMANESVIAKGLCERIGAQGSRLVHKANGKEVIINRDMPTHKTSIQMVLDALVDSEHGVVKSMDEISAVGHRVVHGAEDYNTSVVVDEAVLASCDANAELAPLHNPANIMGIKACQEVMPNTPMVAVFDTAFHATMPDKAYLYGLAYEDYTKLRIRKYGFHGTSHMYVAEEAAKLLGKDIADTKIITCHLGNGSSITAVDGGRSVDTTMGFTPLDGLPMGTRCGSLDPAVIEYYMSKTGATVEQALNHMNKQCGMLGLSENSSDFRDLADGGNIEKENNARAVQCFCYSIKKYIGSYMAAMNGVDAIVFTAGVGENTEVVRQWALEDMEFFGIKLDNDKNYNLPRGKALPIHAEDSAVKIFVIPTNEELVIARETLRLTK